MYRGLNVRVRLLNSNGWTVNGKVSGNPFFNLDIHKWRPGISMISENFISFKRKILTAWKGKFWQFGNTKLRQFSWHSNLSWRHRRHTVCGSLSYSNSTKTLTFYYKVVSDSANFHSENAPKITVYNLKYKFFKWKSRIWGYELWFLEHFRAKCRLKFRLVSWQNNLISFWIKSVTFLLQNRIWFPLCWTNFSPIKQSQNSSNKKKSDTFP